ncbi:hypothetical protein CVT26_000597 [Gymnopilus dilepis]|uniref:SAC3/GANP/THP3 conserved domain-containing protein n=1 Tax=Gymnopilus dilepis TaxID=231916 RepID=A0A409Y280_9AGAR|nr:hypothetical protein CVT26_000597 [Gymnopilus dilepis]
MKSRHIPAQTSKQAVTTIAHTWSDILRAPLTIFWPYTALTEDHGGSLSGAGHVVEREIEASGMATMDGPLHPRGGRGRGGAPVDGGSRGRPHSRNKHWSATDGTPRSSTPNHVDSERWERGGHRASGRGRGAARGGGRRFPNVSLRVNNGPAQQTATPPTQVHDTFTEDEAEEDHEEEQQGAEEEEEEDEYPHEIHEPELNTPEEREQFYQELVKAREAERKKAITEGKMDDPLVPKRLEDAITIVGTCMDMCPRFERYRRERENNLFEWETIPGTKRVDHNRAVKMYERAAGDKTLPSDLRPPRVLKRTLDYLFHDLLPRAGFSATFNFIRDRSRAVRNDFTMQHITGPLAIECHDRCARFHILALHFERERPGFSIPLEEQQLMNTLQSLKEFYEDQRGKYQSPTELEMRVYHRLIHIRDQKERHEEIPDWITSHPVFKLTTEFRLHVQRMSAPISKTSKLIVGEEGMQIFGQLASVLSEQGSRVMIYLVACILERLFGKDTIDNIEGIRGDLSIPDIIDGVSTQVEEAQELEAPAAEVYNEADGDADAFLNEGEEEYAEAEVVDEGQVEEPAAALVPAQPSFGQPSAFSALPAPAPNPPPSTSAFSSIVSTPNVFGGQSVFGTPAFAAPKTTSVFGEVTAPAQPIFGTFPTAAKQEAPPPIFPSSSGTSATPPSSGFFTKAPLTPAPTLPATAFDVPAAQPSTSQPAPQPAIFGSPFAGLSFHPLSQGIRKLTCSPTALGPSKPPVTSLNPKAPEFTFTPTQEPKASGPAAFLPAANGGIKAVAQTVPPFPSFTSTTTTAPQPNGFFTQPPTSVTTQTPPPMVFSKPSPPASTSTTPPTTRLSAPPLLKIDTNTSASSTSTSAAPSPKVPPQLPRHQPIPLPSTPTMILEPPNPLLGHIRNSLQLQPSTPSVSPSGSSQEILSPLVIGSPTASTAPPFRNFTPLSTPKSSRIFKPPSPQSRNGKGKAIDMSDIEEVEEMKKRALAFAQKGLLVKQSFKKWLDRTIERAAYHEACRHGDEYREKLQSSGRGPRPSRTASPSDKKRRLSANGVATGASPQKKRVRKRISAAYQPPRTDEELARRLKENHEEHELRWAPGSFLQVIRKRVKTLKPSALKLPWHIWLSLNPESDATAIWLERKFDMPTSGSWVNESVFSIPLSSAGDPASTGYPGVIVFECTPLGEVTDDLEKKYRILDDCSRLREIIKALPEKRHFIPSLLIIHWTEEGQTQSAPDFFDMIKKLVADGVVQSYNVFAMTSATKDLDNKLDNLLSSLDLDLEGKLVQSLSIRGAFKVFEPTFSLFLSEWMENCNTYGRFNWSLYGQVIQVTLRFLNMMSSAIRSLLELSGPEDPLPDFNPSQIDDSESVYEDSLEWLSTLSSRDDARSIAMDIQSHRNIGQDFPARVFLEHLFELTQIRLERLHPFTADRQQPVLISIINSTLQSVKDSMQPHQMKLLQSYNHSVRRSPKRRNYSSVSTSEQGSPGAKRPRLSASVASNTNEDRSVPSTPQMNGHALETPSPTNSTISLANTEGPTVTVAMLRALTRDLKKKYVH